MSKSKTWAPALLAAAVLVACGGGDNTAPPSSLTITGTAAKGAALAGAKVDVKCVGVGLASATAGSSGAYSLTLDGASLPCALRATGTEGSVFHSAVADDGQGGSHTANITPLTEMMVAKLAAASPASFFDGFTGTPVLTPTAMTQAADYLKTALAGVVDLSGVDPATDTLAVGNALDQKIEAVAARLAEAGVTLPALTAAIAANPGAPHVISAPLAPAAAECAWLKSGRYRVIDPYESDPQFRAAVIEIDAVARTAKVPDGTTVSFVSNGACQFTADSAEETTRVMVSSAGVLVVYSQSKTTPERFISIGLPEQVLPLSDLSGTWNLATWGPLAPANFVAMAGETTIDAGGNVTALSGCLGLAPCAPAPTPFPKLTPNATQGGFDVSIGGLPSGRAFAFKTMAGKVALVNIDNDGGFMVGMRKESLGAPAAVGNVTHYRQFQLNGDGSIGNLRDDTNTVTASDAAARTITRLRSSDSRVDTLTLDMPRDGLRYRAPNSCTVGGAPLNCSETVQLPLQGMGITLVMSVGITPATAFFDVSINKPN